MTGHCLTWFFWLAGSRHAPLWAGPWESKHNIAELLARSRCIIAYTVYDSIYCLKCGCMIISFSWIHFLKTLYCCCPISFHEFGQPLQASLTPDKNPDKSELLSVSSLLFLCLLWFVLWLTFRKRWHWKNLIKHNVLKHIMIQRKILFEKKYLVFLTTTTKSTMKLKL